MILGFGSTEEHREVEECNFADDFIQQNKGDDSYFTAQLATSLQSALAERSTQTRELAEKYAMGDHPERYSTFSSFVLHDASHIVVIFRFMHYNRNHPLSPDGWAAINTSRLHLIDFSS